jgi:HSP20 family protein
MRLTKTAAPPAITTIRDDFDRLFDRFLGGNLFAPPRVYETAWVPNLDFSENEKDYIVRLEAPGIPKEDLEINLDGQTLTLSGRREFAKEEQTEEYFWREREQGRFVRMVQLPAAVDAAKVEATYDNGIMTVKLPKKEVMPKARIAIK